MSPYVIPGLKRIDMQEQTVEKIFRSVCHHFQFSEDDIQVRCRTKELVTARQTIMYLMKRKTTMSLKSIAEKFSLDRTTAIHAVSRIDGFVSINDESTIYNLAQIERLLNT